MLEVAVIGAGSAGLVAARHLLANGLKCCILEAASTLGGAWASSTNNASNNNKKMWNGLHTNLSKHTCRFSDFPWSSSELIAGSTPTFPSHIDMDRYLHSYADEYIDPACFLYNCQVTKVISLNDKPGTVTVSSTTAHVDPKNGGYRVEWTDMASQTKHVKEFDGVIITTGFFSRPKFPAALYPTDESTVSSSCRVLHSKDYTCHEVFQDQTVAVIGSSFSALEIAVDISQSARRVVNILPCIPWVVPRYVPVKDKADNTLFLPVDLAFYRRTSTAGTPPTITLTPEQCRQRHKTLQQLFGSRQQDILGLPRNYDSPPMVAISDYYLDLVADGTIEVIHGRAQNMVEKNGLKVKISHDANGGSARDTIVLPGIDSIICCTGYLPDLQTLLDASILETLQYDSEDMFSPLTACWQTLHPDLPNLALCGMYRGSYMGVVELQARLAAAVLSGRVRLSDDVIERELKISSCIRQQDPRPQFPHFDYVGWMDSLAGAMEESDAEKFPKRNLDIGDVVTPAFYQADDRLAKDAQEDLVEELGKGRYGSHVTSVVMSALIGTWDFHRKIVHYSNNHCEIVHGTIRYSRPKLDYVLYREDGVYRISEHKSLSVFREYEYVCKDDILEVYFVEGGERAHLFLSLKFLEQTSDGYWVATSDHLCIKDLYKGKFKVKLDGLKATEVIISYRVKGPAKDYEATTFLTPQLAGEVLQPQTYS
jgi:cation diffusion facilitator CzcD-associated flavoprotein CzcO